MGASAQNGCSCACTDFFSCHIRAVPSIQHSVNCQILRYVDSSTRRVLYLEHKKITWEKTSRSSLCNFHVLPIFDQLPKCGFYFYSRLLCWSYGRRWLQMGLWSYLDFNRLEFRRYHSLLKVSEFEAIKSQSRKTKISESWKVGECKLRFHRC